MGEWQKVAQVPNRGVENEGQEKSKKNEEFRIREERVPS